MEGYCNTTEKILFYYIDLNNYGHLECNQYLATEKTYKIFENVEDLENLIGKPYIYEEPEPVEKIPFDYDSRVAELIRQHYTIDAEFAVRRKQFTQPDRYQEYFDYCEQCTIQARNERDAYNKL